MPPKKAHTKGTKSTNVNPPSPAPKETIDDSKSNGASKKRKAPQSTDPNKTPRRSARSTPATNSDPLKTLQYLLSPSSLSLCRPKDETEDLKNRDPNTRTYSSSIFTPFEELVCATILSRPIGHMLGLRSIRTIFNPPYEFTTPRTIREAGAEGCRKALDEARTQHRQKTAEELVTLADAVVDHLGNGEDDVSLERVREECERDMGKEREMLKKNVKGLGKTGLDIFGRRIQGVWEEFYPFADGRTLDALQKLGLPHSAEEMRTLIDENTKTLDMADIEASDDEARKRKAFVRICERAVGADLEGNIDDVKAATA